MAQDAADGSRLTVRLTIAGTDTVQEEQTWDLSDAFSTFDLNPLFRRLTGGNQYNLNASLGSDAAGTTTTEPFPTIIRVTSASVSLSFSLVSTFGDSVRASAEAGGLAGGTGGGLNCG